MTAATPSPTSPDRPDGWWRSFLVKLRFKFYLPRVKQACIDGVRLDVSRLSPVVKNRLLIGSYETGERDFVLGHLVEADRVLELGGAIGYLGILARKRLRVQRWASVEANPATLESLRANYRLNGIEADAIHAAFGGSDGSIEFDVSGDFWAHSIADGSKPAGSAGMISVQTMTLTSLIARFGFEPTALVIDVEGAERFIDPRAVPATVRIIVMEIHPGMIGEAAVAAVIDGLVQVGFRHEQREGDVVLLKR